MQNPIGMQNSMGMQPSIRMHGSIEQLNPFIKRQEIPNYSMCLRSPELTEYDKIRGKGLEEEALNYGPTPMIVCGNTPNSINSC